MGVSRWRESAAESDRIGSQWEQPSMKLIAKFEGGQRGRGNRNNVPLEWVEFCAWSRKITRRVFFSLILFGLEANLYREKL